MNAVKLYQKYTIEQLQEMDKKLREDPTNISKEYKAHETIWIYDKKTQRKMDEISWAIYYHLKDIREAKEKETNGQNNQSSK